jgi:DeoR/GlpR family transcriptional regulator of sugar metabolism
VTEFAQFSTDPGHLVPPAAQGRSRAARSSGRARSSRQERIVVLAREQGFASVGRLAEELGVSESTIRRELHELREQGLLNRVFGGALPNSDDLSFTPRTYAFVEEKRRIGQRAAELVSPGDTLILETGTTVLAVADALHTVPNIDIVTSSIDVVVNLQSAANARIVLAGGTFDRHTHTLLGPETERFYADARADKLFIGVGSISSEGLRDSNINAFAVKRAAISAAACVIVVADHSKFSRGALATVADWQQVDVLVTDTAAPANQLANIEKFDVRIIRA